MIKKLATLSAIALASAAAPALAQTGHIGAVYASNNDADVDVWGGEGAATFNLGPSFGVQVDGALGSANFEGSDNLAWRINGHLFYNYGDFRVGAVAGESRLDVDVGHAPEASHWGLEGQYWFNRFSIGASAVWGNSDWLISPHIDYHNYDLNADFYATDNFVIGARYGVGSLNNGVGSDADTRSYGLDAEWQLDSVPISFTAGYNHWEIQDTPVESEAWSVGVRWNWGAGSVMARDRAGFRNSPATLLDRFFGF